jgi:integrase
MGMHSKLTRTFVKNVTKNGLYNDGGGLNLQVRGVSKIWMFGWRDRDTGKKRSISLGPNHTVDQERAREEAAHYRGLLRDGKDPLVERNGARLDQEIEAGRARTVNQVVEEFWEEKIVPEGLSASRLNHLQGLLRKYVRPTIWGWPIDKVDTDIILEIVGLRRLWQEHNPTAKNLQILLWRIFKFAKTKRYFHGDNPAAWKNHLDDVLPKSGAVHEVKHRASLPYQDAPRFLATLRAYKDGSTHERGHTVLAMLVECLLLSGVRTQEMRLATWGEIDLENMVWTVPWQHLKTGKTHKRDRPIPITKSMLAVLKEMQRRRTDQSPNALVFPSPRGGPYCVNSCTYFLSKILKWTPKINLHGFRSTLPDWCRAEWARPNYNDLWKLQANHTLAEDKSDGSYGHDRLLDQRRVMMDAYDEHCEGTTPAAGTNVAQFKRRRAA